MLIIRDLSDMSKNKFYSDYWAAYDGLVNFLLCLFFCKREQRLITE
ncbi:hypothetical protein [Campylobacter troglodytis]